MNLEQTQWIRPVAGITYRPEPHQAEDGTAHIAFFDKESCTSFVWNLTQGTSVDVCPGGYGEPVQDQFGLDPAIATDYELPDLLRLFAGSCMAYLQAQQDDAEAAS